MGIISPVLANEFEPSLAFVCMLGIVVVFVGLICIVGIIMIMNILCSGRLNQKKDDDEVAPPQATAAPVYAAPAAPVAIENRSEIVAAVCAAVAEEEGTDVSAIRVISFKKIN
ncbi:MAG: hypothetical protein E7640_06060 [Ruminococcaceae bacterium]|nr:hypothetical protein [Oscillospiraceae bacterium]